jgi:SPP1 family predicted phage head-tail adaptor
MTLAAGNLRHRIELQRQSRVQDGETGEETVTWVEAARLWASVEPLSAREFVASAAKQSQVTTRITIRYRSDIDATMRILHRGRIFNIEGVLSDRESGLEYLTLPCSEGTNDGA